MGAVGEGAQGTRSWRTWLPTVLTGLRALAIPVVLSFWLRGRVAPALAVYGFILVSDAADGRLARSLGAVTRLGAILDPVVDIVAVLSLLSACVARGAAPWWCPLAPVAAAAVFLGTLGRSTRPGRIGKSYGAILYIALIPLLIGVPTSLSLWIGGAAACLSGVVMLERVIGVVSGAAQEAR